MNDPVFGNGNAHADRLIKELLGLDPVMVTEYPACVLKPWADVQTGDVIWRETTQEYRTITRIAPLAELSRYMYYFPDGSDTERSFQVFEGETAVVMADVHCASCDGHSCEDI
jgi:hypothetical protein